MGTIFQVNESNGNTTITGSLNMSSQQIHSVADPTISTDAATKNYVDTVANGITWKQAVAAATVAVLPFTPTYANGASGVGATLTAGSNGVLTVDGYTVLLNDRVLVQNQASAFQNGIYSVTTLGTGSVPYVLTRTTDYNTPSEVQAGTATFAQNGTVNADSGFVQTTTGTITIGTTALNFTQFTGLGEVTAGNGLSKSGNTISLIAPVTVANGGTNSTTALAGSKLIRSSATALVESQVTADGSGNLAAISSLASNSANPATAGLLRLASADVIDWRNNANSANISLSKNTSDVLQYNGNNVVTTITGTTNQINTSISGNGVTLSTPQDIATTSTPTFANLTLTQAGSITHLINATGVALARIQLEGNGNSNYITTSSDGSFDIQGNDASNFIEYNPTSHILRLAQSPATSVVSDVAITVSPTTNQLVLGTTRTVTISATQPATSSRTYTIPDQGANANIVGDKANYTIGGTWTFSNDTTFASSKKIILTDNTTNTVALKATNSTTSYTLSLPTTSGTSGYVLSTDGSGNTSWVVNGVGVVGSGTQFQLPYYAATGTTLTAAANINYNASGNFEILSGHTLQLDGSTSGNIQIAAANTTTSYTIKMPAAQGAASTSLQNDGSGNLSWTAAGGTGTIVQNAYVVGTSSGTYTGSTTVYNLPFTYVQDNKSLQVMYNGQVLIPGIDYTETSATSVTTTNALITGASIVFRSITASTPANTSTSQYINYVVGTSSGTYTGSTTVYNLPFAYTQDGKSLWVYYDGVRLTPGDDYTETSTTSITTTSALVSGQKIAFSTISAAGTANSATFYRENYVVGTATGNYTGSSTVFNLVNTYVVGGVNLTVYLDGDLQTLGATVDYLETNTTTITFNNALITGQKVAFCFSQSSSPSGTVSSGTAGQVAYYPASNSTVASTSAVTVGTHGPNAILVGTNSSDAAAAGQVGEYLNAARQRGSELLLTTSTPANVTSISLTPGQWLVFGQIGFDVDATTVLSTTAYSLSTTSATLTTANTTMVTQDASGQMRAEFDYTASTIGNTTRCYAPLITVVNVASTTTYYLVTNVSFTTANVNVFGSITATRMR